VKLLALNKKENLLFPPNKSVFITENHVSILNPSALEKRNESVKKIWWVGRDCVSL